MISIVISRNFFKIPERVHQINKIVAVISEVTAQITEPTIFDKDQELTLQKIVNNHSSTNIFVIILNFTF